MNWLRTSTLVLASGVLAACAATPQPDTPPEVPPAPEEQPAVSSDCDCAQPYRIALLLPLSGPYQDLGSEAFNGATMAFYEQHSPREVELRPYDTTGTVEGARAATRQALEDGVDVFVGPVFTENVRAAAAVAAPEGVAVMALSNDKSVASETVTVLGGHLEEEVASLVQIVLRRNRRNVLLFAPDNAYGTRLRDEFQTLLAPHYQIAFNAPLFPRHASADELTKLVSRASGFETRYARLNEVLKAFQTRWEETSDSSEALTQTVAAFDLAERWAEAYPPTCRYEEDETAPEGDLLAAEAPGAIDMPDAPEPLVTDAPQAAQQTQMDTPEAPEAPEAAVVVDIPEEPARMAAYEHVQLCERPEPDPELLDLLADPDAPPPQVDDMTAQDDAGLPDQNVAQQPEQEPAPESTEEPAQEATQEPTPEPAQDVAQEPAEEAPVVPDEPIGMVRYEGVVFDAPPAPDPAEEAAYEAELRHEAAVQDARFDLLNDVARCITYLSEQDYEAQKGVETIARRFAKREVLGPPKTDTIILPLSNDRLRLVSSLFDYYHAGREQNLILGTSLWDKAGDLSDELSLRGAKWVSDMRPHSTGGGQRYTSYFHEEPGYFSALAFDAVKLALNETRAEETGIAPPGAVPYVTGESGVLRVLDDGTNERRVAVKEVTDSGETVSNSLSVFLAGAPFRAAQNKPAAQAERLSPEQYLRRMCVGTR